MPTPPPPYLPNTEAKGGGLFEFQNPPPPPPDPPQLFEPVFLQFEILGERVSAEGAENFLWPFLRGYFFFFTLCVYTQNTQNFVEKSKTFEKKHRKFF